jgi:hypothetical protein
MTDKIFNIIIKLVKQGGADAETVRGLTEIKKAMQTGTAVIGTMVAAYYAADKVLQATVGEFTSYAKNVDIFSSALSTSSEQGSRLIQIADDLGISSDELQTSLFRAVKNGMDPTVAGLAKMADAYVALNDPQDKANFLIKNFGKSSQELARLLAEGGVGIRARSAAIQDSLVLDTAAIQKQREYEAALDDTGDAVKAAKTALGELFAGPVTQFMVSVANAANGWLNFMDVLSYNKSVVDLARKLAEADGWVGILGSDMGPIPQKYMNAALAQKNWTVQIDKFKQAGAIDYTGMAKDIENQAAATLSAADAEKAAAAAAKAEADALETLRNQIIDQTSWEQSYMDLNLWGNKNQKSWADITKLQLDWLGNQLQGLSDQGAQVWEGFLVATGKISPAAVEQFAIMQNGFEQMKKMLEMGVNVKVAIKYFLYLQGYGPLPWDQPNPDPSTWGDYAGGSHSAGEWAMVGDAPGGRVTPYTEYVHAEPGGGFTVYNQRQMSSVSMAGGGSVPGDSREILRALERLPELIGTELDKRIR